MIFPRKRLSLYFLEVSHSGIRDQLEIRTKSEESEKVEAVKIFSPRRIESLSFQSREISAVSRGANGEIFRPIFADGFLSVAVVMLIVSFG